MKHVAPRVFAFYLVVKRMPNTTDTYGPFPSRKAAEEYERIRQETGPFVPGKVVKSYESKLA